MQPIDYKKRLASLKTELEGRRLDALLVTKDANVAYLSGFPDSDSLLLVTKKEDFFITDSRFIEDAQGAVKNFTIKLAKPSTYKTLADIFAKYRFKRIGFESMDLPYDVAQRLKSLSESTRIVPVKNMIDGARAVKDPAELKLIRGSIRLAKLVFEKAAHLVRPGESEIKIAEAIESEFIKNGAKASFEPIVASGANSSKPHARPQDTTIGKGGFAMLDIGCRLHGYHCDITRMVFLGRLKGRLKKIYDIVLAAQALAIGMVKPGGRIASVDLAARRHIQKFGLGRFFGHSLGHGVGLEVHEEPSISANNVSFLKPGMVFTIEPAVYIPKFGGVRIEDMVLVTDSGCEILT